MLKYFRTAAAIPAHPSPCSWLSRDKKYNLYIYTPVGKKKMRFIMVLLKFIDLLQTMTHALRWILLQMLV